MKKESMDPDTAFNIGCWAFLCVVAVLLALPYIIRAARGG